MSGHITGYWLTVPKGRIKVRIGFGAALQHSAGRLSAFQSLLGHDKWCWMRSVKGREIRNTELPTENEQLVWKNKLVTQRNWVQGICGGSNQHAARGIVTCGRWGDRLQRETTRLQSGCWIMRTVHIGTRSNIFSLRRKRTCLRCAALCPFDWTHVTTVTVKQPAETIIVLCYEGFITESPPWLVKLQCCHSYPVCEHLGGGNDNLIHVSTYRCKLFCFFHIRISYHFKNCLNCHFFSQRCEQ